MKRLPPSIRLLQASLCITGAARLSAQDVSHRSNKRYGPWLAVQVGLRLIRNIGQPLGSVLASRHRKTEGDAEQRDAVHLEAGRASRFEKVATRQMRRIVLEQRFFSITDRIRVDGVA